MYAKPPPTLKAIRIIVICLAMGLIGASAAFAALHFSGSISPPAAVPNPAAPGAAPAPAPNQPDLMLFVLAALAMGAALMLAILPRQMMRQSELRFQEAQSDDERDAITLNTISSVTIMRCAMVEGVGLFGAVIFFLNAQWPLLIVPGLAALVILAFYPTDAKVAAVRERLERSGHDAPRSVRAMR